MLSPFAQIYRSYIQIVYVVENTANAWFLGVFSRFLFTATLYVYYLNSAQTKVGKGFFGFFQISDSAFIQILGRAYQDAGYDVHGLSAIAKIIVVVGTYSEFVLPVLVVFGLFSRIAASGMIIFIAVQTFVDVTNFGVTIGGLFNGQPGDIVDQRLFWTLPLVYVATKGPGLISLDALFARLFFR